MYYLLLNLQICYYTYLFYIKDRLFGVALGEDYITTQEPGQIRLVSLLYNKLHIG